jgi:hypothetical protein
MQHPSLSERKRPFHAPWPKKRDSGGFVLVAVLLLIALATVLIVTTSSVSEIERKAVSNSSKQEIAKQNALFALQIAIAQLQSTAGPDQRVTATADILNSNSANPSPVSQPYWTGVWPTANPGWTNDPARSPWIRPQPLDVKLTLQTNVILRQWASTNVVWLVSGATNTNSVNPLSWKADGSSGVAAFAYSTNSVIMANNWGTNTSTTGNNTNASQVLAPLVALKNGTTNTGRYAYWVSDEGVKAKLALSDTNMTTRSPSTQGMLVSALLHFMAPSAPNVSTILTNYGISSVLTNDFRSYTNLAKFTSLGELAFITNNIPVFTNNNLAADLTVYSYGVLCDVRRGGLKQDLTAAMESTAANPTAFRYLQYRSGAYSGSTGYTNTPDSLMAFRAANAALPIDLSAKLNSFVGTRFDGLLWQSVYNYYNLYKSFWPKSPLVNGTTSSPYGVGAPSIATNNKVLARGPVFTDPALATTNINCSMMTPAIISDSIVAQLGVTGTNIHGTNTYFFTVSYYPMVVLYNPYSVSLDLGKSAFTITKSLANSLAVRLTCKTNGTLGVVTTTAYGSDNKNLWPACTAGGTTTTNTVFQLNVAGYPISFSLTNPVGAIMDPGEIRVYGVAGANRLFSSNDLATYSQFSSSSGRRLTYFTNMVIGGGYGGVSVMLTNWGGSTNLTDTVTLTYLNSPSIFYNTIHYTATANYNTPPNLVSTWPANASSTAIELPGGLNGTGTYSGMPNATFVGFTTNTTMGALSNTPITIVSASERLKGPYPAMTYRNYTGYGINLPMFMGNSIFYNAHRSCSGLAGIYTPATETDSFITNEPAINIVNSYTTPNASTVSWLAQPVGDAAPLTGNSSNNNVNMVLRDVPIAPMISLGQLMHLDEYYNEGTGVNTLFPTAFAGMSIGGSYCAPETGPYMNALIFNGNSAVNQQWHLFSDNSFLANEALFDTYYFSTVPPTNGFSWGSGLSGTCPFTNISSNSIAQRQPLPNSRYVYYCKNGTNPTVGDLQDESKAAANLLVDGAFNINSTSVPAWKALLSSLSGQDIQLFNYILGQIENRNVINPILRFWSAARYSANAPWDGMRSLTDAQVTVLAQEIVRQVKARGPFLSMGDFLNRRLAPITTSTNQLTTNNFMGALQAAIENTQTNLPASIYDVNYNIHNCPRLGTTNSTMTPFWNSLAGTILPSTNTYRLVPISTIVTNSATGIPGYLMQQDLVQAFAPVMTARSDTFMIRVYGESDKPSTNSVTSGGILSQVWGEAVVQRLPDYFDQTDTSLTTTLSSVNDSTIVPGIVTPLRDATPPYNASGATLNTVNQNFGRRFKIISFRWLNPNEL